MSINGITILPELSDSAKKHGFTLSFGQAQVIARPPIRNSADKHRLIMGKTPIQLGWHGEIVMEISDLGRMHEIQTYLSAFELGYRAHQQGY